MKSLAKASVIASLLAATAVSQLVAPNTPVTTSDNVKLIAHTKSSSLGIENWEVASGDNGCDQALVLSEPSSIAASSALTFFFNPNPTTLQSEAGGTRRGLVISENGHRRSLILSCNSNGTAGLGVRQRPVVPALDYQSDGQFYACRTGSQSQSEPTRLFYGDSKTKQLPQSCVKVALFAKATTGPYHGDLSIVLACEDVKDGDCCSTSMG